MYMYNTHIYIYITCINIIFKKHKSKSYIVKTKAMTLEGNKRIDWKITTDKKVTEETKD
jgi:hypothetical protein